MQEILDVGIRQGVILFFSDSLESSDQLFDYVKSGRFGLFSDESVGTSNILLVLSQECSISGRRYIEVVQGKKERRFDAKKNSHLLDAQDYGKLVIKVGEFFYGFREHSIAKIAQEVLLKAIQSGKIFVGETIAPHIKRRLLDWRVLEYVREPFPDRFNRALFEYRTGRGGWFFNYLLENQDKIDSLRIFISPDEEENAEEYQIIISALLTDQCEETLSEEISQQIEKMLTEFHAAYPFIAPIQK